MYNNTVLLRTFCPSITAKFSNKVRQLVWPVVHGNWQSLSQVHTNYFHCLIKMKVCGGDRLVAKPSLCSQLDKGDTKSTKGMAHTPTNFTIRNMSMTRFLRDERETTTRDVSFLQWTAEPMRKFMLYGMWVCVFTQLYLLSCDIRDRSNADTVLSPYLFFIQLVLKFAYRPCLDDTSF